MASIKIRAKAKDGKVKFKALISHPMETGLRKDKKTGGKIPPHYISDVVVTAGDKTLMTAKWSGSVSKNPYISFNYSGASGDDVKLMWTDNKGETDTAEAKVK